MRVMDATPLPDFGVESTKDRDAEVGEELAALAAEYGKLAAKFLFRSQWGYDAPEWFDHRLHLLDPDEHFTDFWTASADNVVRSLPLGGKLLDLCSGDGFYDYRFYRHRASRIVAIEKDSTVYDFAVSRYSDPAIQYVCADVRTHPIEQKAFDVVVIRGAIEHFSAEDQQSLFAKSKAALKPGGYFCGDTAAAYDFGEKMLSFHECEWRNEAEMREALSTTFTDVETWAIESKQRTSLFWRCRV